MHVLLWNRHNARTHPGGDTVQWEHTARELEALGVEVELTTDPRPDLAGFDLVHLFNLQCVEEALPVAEQARAAGLPLALSTIWWDPIEAKYVSARGRWLTMRLREWAVGRPKGLAHFRAWKLSRKRSHRTRAQVHRLLELSDVLLPNSVGELRVMEDYFELGDLSDKAVIVPNATTGAAAPPPTASGLRAGVLCVGRVYPLKNQLALIEALCGLDAELVLVGDLSYEAYVAECRRAAARHGRCQLLGPLAHEALGAHYRAARVHVLPSFRETPGLVSLEAAAHGATVVTTDRGPTREYFGDDAYYLDPASGDSIRAAVERALAAPLQVSAERLGRFTWRKAALATRQAYRWLLDRGAERPGSLDVDCERYA
ncbi:MAG: glycosyltransferase family 4 protein [Planctomycetota bacterium]